MLLKACSLPRNLDSRLNKSQRIFSRSKKTLELYKGTSMTIPEITTATPHQSNARAEDGVQERSSWSFFCEAILIPLGSLGVIMLAMLSL